MVNIMSHTYKNIRIKLLSANTSWVFNQNLKKLKESTHLRYVLTSLMSDQHKKIKIIENNPKNKSYKLKLKSYFRISFLK